MKAIMWEYKTFELTQNATMKTALDTLNNLGQDCWELVAIKEVNSVRMSSEVKRTFFILKRPMGQVNVNIK